MVRKIRDKEFTKLEVEMLRNNQKAQSKARISGLALFFLFLGLTAKSSIAVPAGQLLQRISSAATSLQASYSYSPLFPKAGQPVKFIDTSQGSPTSWRWDFGDGTRGYRQNPTHTFATSGYKKITLTVVKGSESRKTIRTVAILTGPPEASFVFSPATPGPGQAVQFTDTTTGGPTSWLWNFGDGSTSTAKNPQHAYGKAGAYLVTLRAGCSAGTMEAKKTLTVASMSPLTSAFSFSPTAPIVNQAVQFTDTTAGSPTSWRWDFGDGSNSTLRNPSHSYVSAGTYRVGLTATNGTQANTASRDLTVMAASPIKASFVFSPAAPVAEQPVQFTDTSAGSSTSWHWDFNDGATSQAQNPSHMFASPGTYGVTLTITDGSGSDSASVPVSVILVDAITAASPALSDVSAAIARANEGDTVVIPAGTATWTSPLVYSKGIHLRGAGIGKTVITHTGVGIKVTGREGAPWTISGLEMLTSGNDYCIEVRGNCKDFRISGCRFLNPTSDGATVLMFGNFNDGADYPCGLVDNCEIVDGGILVSAGTGEGSWKESTDLGSDRAIYIEDCVFRRPNRKAGMVIDSNNGARYVFRHNYVEDGYAMAHSLQNGWDNHFARGSRLVEIYGNTFKAARQEHQHWAAMFIRGGTGVIFDNQVTNEQGVTPFAHAVVIDNVRSFREASGNLGMANGSNPIDGNIEPNGYPALDQIGRGRDAGELLDPIPRYGATNRTSQALEPMHIWNNSLGGEVREPRVHNGCEIHIQLGRDYKTTPKPDYLPYPYPHPLRIAQTN